MVLDPWISAVAIVAIGLLAWWYNRHLASLKATLDYISTTEGTSEEWLALRKEVAALKTAGSLVAVLGANESEEKTQKIATICTYLNHFELTAVGINHGIINKKLYAEWFRGAYIQTWRDSQSFVTELRARRDQPKLYREFEDLAVKWAKKEAREKIKGG